MPYCLLMDGLSKAGRLDEAKAIYDEMNKKGVKSGISSRNYVVGPVQFPLLLNIRVKCFIFPG